VHLAIGMLLWLGFAIAFGVGSGRLMSRRGYPSWLGFSIGFVLGVFGLVIALVAPRRASTYDAAP
jgi:hypothetical protein